jgi:hypothetical protein
MATSTNLKASQTGRDRTANKILEVKVINNKRY